MTSRFFERRAVRNQIKAFLDVNGWDDLTWAEGFSATVLDVVKPPFISVMLDDLGKNQLEMGNDPEINKTFTRRLQRAKIELRPCVTSYQTFLMLKL
jgi:hypothetical protein